VTKLFLNTPLVKTLSNRGKFLGNLVGLGWHGSDKFGERWDWGAW
jgi:hypothetical protein